MLIIINFSIKIYNYQRKTYLCAIITHQNISVMKTYFTKLLRVALLLLVMLLQGAAATVALADGEHSITTIVEGQGTATVWDYSGENQINTAPEGNLFRLVATPAEGWRFVEWQLVSGDGDLQYPTYKTAYYRIGYQDAVIRAVFEGIPHTVSTMSTLI